MVMVNQKSVKLTISAVSCGALFIAEHKLVDYVLDSIQYSPKGKATKFVFNVGRSILETRIPGAVFTAVSNKIV